MDYLKAVIVVGILCVIGQILVDKTKLTPARILVLFVVSGVILGGLGIYEKIVAFGGCGATVPLTGFGYSLAKGAIEGAQQNGLIGALAGGLKSTSAGIAMSIAIGLIVSLLFQPKLRK